MSNLPIIDAEFEDIPNHPLPNSYGKPTKKPKLSRKHPSRSNTVNLVDSKLPSNRIQTKKKTKVEDTRGRLDILAKGIVQEQSGNELLANLAGEFISVLVGKKVKGPEFQFLSKLMNGGF